MMRYRYLYQKPNESGQVLLLAVVLLLLIALLGAGFISLISANLTQTARQEDQVSVDKAAWEGMNFANEQFQHHPSGADWRPIDSAPPWMGPSPSAPDDVEMTRNWTPPFGFYKFKTQDPNANSYFLLRVRSQGLTPANAANSAARYVEITTIGRSLNDTGIFKILTAYKPIGITDYARNVTAWQTAPGAQGVKRTVSIIGKPSAIDYDADAVLRANVPSGTTIIPVSNPQVFSGDNPNTVGVVEGDYVLIGRDPHPSGAPLAANTPFNNTVGIREQVRVASVDIVNHRITLVSAVGYNHEAGEPLVVGTLNTAGNFLAKKTYARLVRSAGTNATSLLVTNVRGVAMGDQVCIGTNISTANPPRTEDCVTVSAMPTDNATASPPMPSVIPFDNTMTPLTTTHEKDEPVRVVRTNVSNNTNDYESRITDITTGISRDPLRETEWTGTIVRGPVFSNAEMRFFGSTTFDFRGYAGGRIESASSISYDVEGSADSAGVSIGHRGDTAVLVGALGNRVPATMTGNDALSRDGQARRTGSPTNPFRWVRRQTPPLIAQEGLFSGDPGPAGDFRFQRYDELTRYSDPRRLTAGAPTLGEMGFGKGIYLDNLADVQFITLANPTPLARFAQRRTNLMTQWTTGTPVNDPGLDGTLNTADDVPQWVNNGLEYVPLGVQIILRDDDVVWDPSPLMGPPRFVNLGTANFHPTGAPHVSGRPVIWVIRSDKQPLGIDRSGAMPTVAPVPVWTTDPRTRRGLYFMSFDYPDNGVIVAHGNVRIKGNLPKSYPISDTMTNNHRTNVNNIMNGTIAAGDRDYNLTVVSGGTIYVEGNILSPRDILNSDPTAANDLLPILPNDPPDPCNTHLALMAKDHVTLNTTQFYSPTFDPTLFAAMPPTQILDPGMIHSFWDLPPGSPTPILRQFNTGEPYAIPPYTTAAASARLSVAAKHGGSKKTAFDVSYVPDPNMPAPNVKVFVENSAMPPSFAPPYPYGTPVNYRPTNFRSDEPPNGAVNACFNDPGPDMICGTADDGLPKTIAQVATDINNATAMPARYSTTLSADPLVGPLSPLMLARFGENESAPAYLQRANALQPAFELPLITQAGLSMNGNAVWQVGNMNDPFALFESFYQNPLLRPMAGMAPAVQPLATQSMPDPFSTGGIPASMVANLAGAPNQLQFDATTTGGLANYRLSQFKMEQYVPGPDPLIPGSTVYRPTWGLTIKVNALIYAQEGSWFVIPGPYFDADAANDDTRPGRGDAVRYRRYNYRVIVEGAVVENQTADDFPVTVGNRNVYTFNSTKWEERIAFPSYDANLSAYVWNGIEYRWDSELKFARWAAEDIITGNLKPVPKIPKLPMGPDLIFIG
jgi:hypothetical protein